VSINKERERYLKSGLSGCLLVISNDAKIITKESSCREYDHRLLLQAGKQKKFLDFNLKNILCPTVINISEKKPTKFSMSYISGIQYDHFLNYSSPQMVNKFSLYLDEYIKFLSEDNNTYYTDTDFKNICIAKINLIKSSIPDLKFLDYIKSRIYQCSNVSVPLTFCHGDLTLSNIIFCGDSIYLIDFLDSYIESWIIDIIKLKQDLFYFWNISRGKNGEKTTRSMQSSLHIWYKIDLKYKKITESDEFKILEALNFLRIYPYIKDTNEKKILNNIIKKLPIYEEFNNTNGREII
jgi:hypothetical protein